MSDRKYFKIRMICHFFIDSTKQEAETAWTSGIGAVVKKTGGYLTGDSILYRFKDVLHKQLAKTENMAS